MSKDNQIKTHVGTLIVYELNGRQVREWYQGKVREEDEYNKKVQAIRESWQRDAAEREHFDEESLRRQLDELDEDPDDYFYRAYCPDIDLRDLAKMCGVIRKGDDAAETTPLAILADCEQSKLAEVVALARKLNPNLFSLLAPSRQRYQALG